VIKSRGGLNVLALAAWQLAARDICRSQVVYFFFFFYITLEPRVEGYTSLCALNTSPPRNRCRYCEGGGTERERERERERAGYEPFALQAPKQWAI